MTLKRLSGSPQVFTFTYDFPDFETAHIASYAVSGYITGTYNTPLENTIKPDGRLVTKYVEDENINDILKRICEVFTNYNPQAGEVVAEISW